VRKILIFGVALGAAVLSMVGIPASPAAAHAELVSSEPASGDVLDTPPEQVVLNFTEGVQVGDDAVELFVSAGDQVDVGDTQKADGGAVVTVDLPELDDGAYVVAWRVTSADSHPIHGAFTFRVGAAASGDDAEAEALMTQLVTDEGGDTTVGTLYGAVRFVGFAGMVLLVGGAAIVAILWPAGRHDRRTRRLVTAGWLTFAVATILSFGFQAAYAAAEPLSGVVDLSLVGEVFGTRAGAVWLVRLGLLVVVAVAGWRLLPRPEPAVAHASDLSAAARVGPVDDAVASVDTAETAAPGSAAEAQAAWSTPLGTGARFPVVAAWRREPAKLATAAVLALALLATVSLAGHAGTGRWVPLAVVLDVVHLAAICLWLGGLTLLLVAVVRTGTATEPTNGDDSGPAAPRPRQAAQVVAGFSTLAFAAVVVIVVTGSIQAWRQLGSIDAITGTTYGRLLVTKVLLVAAILAAAYFSRRWVQNRRSASSSETPTASPADEPDGDGHETPTLTETTPDQERRTVRALRRSVGAEVLVAGGVLAVTALLVNTVPGVDDTSGGGTYETEVHSTDLLVQVEVDPAATGPADIRITTLTHDEQPTEPQELAASITLPERDLGPIPLNLETTGEGRYIARNTDIPFPGTWQLEIDAREDEFNQDTVTAEIPVE
jgi:copper transport protein